jgi:PAS domain S-box-containing protein
VGALMRAHDWSASPLGPPEMWPQSLRTVVNLILNSRFPMFAAWGHELTFFYNDAYVPLLGSKHPAALGNRFADVWADAWSDLKPLVDASMAGEATYFEDWPLRTNRNGYDEQTWFTFSYSPVQDDDGRIAGMFCACTETTERVQAGKRAEGERTRQRQMLRQMPGFVGMLSGPDLVYEYVNDAYIAICERKDFIGRPFRDIFGDIEGQGFRELFEHVFHTGESVVTRGMELRLHGRSDKQYVDFVLEPIRDDDGIPKGVFVGGYETTDVYRGNEALRASEARYRTLFENIDAAFCVVDVIFDENGRPVDHRFLEINPAFERQSGLNDALGRRAREILPEHEQHWFDIYGAIARTGVPARFENGSQALGRWFDVHALRVGEPEQNRVAVLFNDITERKKAEDRLRELNETLEQRIAAGVAERKLLADLVEGTDTIIQVADLDYRWLAVNKAGADAFERVYGVRPRVGESMLAVLADRPEHQAAVRAAWSRALAGEEFTATSEFGDPNFDRRSYEIKFNTLRDAGGERIGAYQFVHDVTDRVEEQRRLADAEAARRQADALYRAYFENTAEALFVIGVLPDGGFTVQDLNPAHQASIGLPIDQVRGKRIDEVLPAELAEPVAGYYRRVVASGEMLQYRETFDLNGSPTYWDTVLVPVPGADGRIEALIGSSRDLTRQQAAEEQLRQTQKMEAMGQLTGGVAHDFNNLLTPIIGSLDMLMRRGVGNDRERRLIDGALQSAERAKTLVQRLLAFARRQPLQPSAVDLGTLVEGMAGLIGSTLGPTIDVKVALADDLPPAKADPNQLEMALLNLAVNARDAMPDGGVLTIGARRESVRADHPSKLRQGHYVVVCVSDTGVGMDEATLARAVEPFFSTKGIGKGTGLGLSMAHGLAAQLGGALMIDSTPGRGTTIELWLPVSLEPIDDEAASTVRLPARKHRGKALLVDDEELVRMSTADMLTDLGFEVTEASSAEEALRLVEQIGPPDLLVTDHLMPGMSGADLARELLARASGLSVLIVSGYAEAEGIAPDLPRLTKPFRNAELAESISNLRP